MVWGYVFRVVELSGLRTGVIRVAQVYRLQNRAGVVSDFGCAGVLIKRLVGTGPC